MRRSPRGPFPVLGVVAVLVVLLVALAVLQYRWIGQISDAERHRLRNSLFHASGRFCDEVDRELIRIVVTLGPALRGDDDQFEERLAQQARRWKTEATIPSLVSGITVVRRPTAADPGIECLDWRTGLYAPCAWPAAFASVRADIEAGKTVPFFPEGVAGFVMRRFRGGMARGDRGPGWRARGESPGPTVLVALDEKALIEQMLPKLAAEYFSGPAGLEYNVLVVRRSDPSQPIFRFGPGPFSVNPADNDVARAFVAVRPVRGFSGMALEPFIADREGGEAGPERSEAVGGGDDAIRGEGRWLLLVTHPAGSLDAAVDQARERNLAIGLSVLALLCLSAILLVTSSQRAQRLARQQLDFVAAVSHELRTPLTAIRSAGENLADGVVADGDQVRRYGSLIASEGRRLTEMVTRVLDFAGIRSGQRAYQLQPTALDEVVLAALRDAQADLESRGFTVAVEIQRPVPLVAGDAGALRQVVDNLIDNAAKFGAAARWIGVRLEPAAAGEGSEVVLSVSDRGPGIRRAEFRRVFDPFFRSADPEVAAVPGSGLGLAVVRHIVDGHNGRVEIRSAPGQGATFEVHLAALPAGAGDEAAT